MAGAQHPPQGTQSQGSQGRQPQVPPADPEGHGQPAVEGRREKQQVPEGVVPGPQGTQESVHAAQGGPQRQAPEEPDGGSFRGGHFSRRLSRKPGVRGSS